MDVNRENLLGDMRKVVAHTQELLEAGGDKLGKTRETVAEHLASAKESLVDLERDMQRRARRVNYYAQDNPWRIAGAALAVGLVLGALLGISAGQRRD